MSFRAGRMTAIYLSSIDASPYFNAADSARTMDTADVTAFGATAKSYISGEEDSTFSASGFFDGGVGLIDENLWTLGNAGVSYPATYCPDGGAVIGRQAQLVDLLETDVTPSSPIGGAVSLKLSAQVSGGLDWGKILNDNAQISATVPGTPVDWGAIPGSTTNGGIMNIHVTLNTRTTTTAVKLQHSTDGTTFVDLTGAAQTVPIGHAVDATHPFGTPTAYTLPVSGTVNRYLRAVITPTAGTGLITAVVAFARF